MTSFCEFLSCNTKLSVLGLGKLLREVQPELMDSLIQATKDGDHSKLQALSGSKINFEDSDEETDSEDEEEVVLHLFSLLR